MKLSNPSGEPTNTQYTPSTDMRRRLKEAAQDFSRLGMFVLTVGRNGDGTPEKKSFGRWNKNEFPRGTTLEQVEFEMSFGGKSGLWVRIPDGWCVIDPDTDEAVEYWTDRLGETLNKAGVSKPPNGRPHWWFKVPDGFEGILNWSAPSSNTQNVRFDVRGQARGGVIAPPSEHHRGGHREWLVGLENVVELSPEETGLLSHHTLPGAPERSGKDLTPLGGPRPPKYAEGEGTKYGKTALGNELTDLKKVWGKDDGTFNNTLNAACFSIGQLVSGGELEHEFTYGMLQGLLDELGAPNSEYKTLNSGYFDGFDRPRTSTAFDSKFFGKINGRSDELMVATLATTIRDAGPLGVGINGYMWAYTEGVWKTDKYVVRDRAARLLSEAFRARHASDAEAFIKGLVPTIECEPQSRWVNFKNGLLDWKTGKMHPHSADVLSTVQMNVEWDPDAECPEFDKFLGSVIPEDMVDTMWELIGYLMYSGNPLHKAALLIGTGRNGKGTWIRTIKAILGDENVTAVTLQALTMERFAAASLFGKIANIAGDIDGTYLEQTAKFKAVTGQDVITAEMKNQDPFDFTPWAVPVFSANKIPGSADVTAGYMSRWLIMPFPNNFTGKEDRGLDGRLQRPEELKGIAAKAMPALRRLMERGNFEEPETGSAKEAMDEFKRRTNQVETWLHECCELDAEDAWMKRNDMYDAYRRWAEHGKYGVLKAAEFYDRIRNAGVKESKRRGIWGFKDAKITTDFDKTAAYRATWEARRATDMN